MKRRYRRILKHPQRKSPDVKDVAVPSKEQEAADAAFDTLEVDPGEIQEDHEGEFHKSALGDIPSDKVLEVWKLRGLHYRGRFLSIIIDVLACVNALSDIQAHFRKESIDPRAEYVTDAILSEFEWVVGDKLVHELILNLFAGDPEAGKRAHAYILALKTSRRPLAKLSGLKSLVDNALEDSKTDESPFGNLATHRSYSDDRPR